MSQYVAVTACAVAAWPKYGRRMAESFCTRWPAEIPLFIYTQDFTIIEDLPVAQENLYVAAPWLVPWKARRTKADHGCQPNGRYEFRQDAVLFSHKVAAIGAAVEHASDVLIWIDADVITHAQVTTDWLDGLFTSTKPLAWLDRQKLYPETSFMMFRLPAARTLIDQVVALYQNDGIFDLPETHDAAVFQYVVTRSRFKAASLSGDGRVYHNAFANSPLALRLDHLKGNRKDQDRTAPHERKVRDKNAYWRC